MLGATGAVTCPWKGKRLPSFALGHREAMTRSLDLAGSSEYHRALLNARPEDAAAIADMDVVVKRALAHALHDKLAYLEALPYKLAGAFGEYCGSSLQRAKKCVRECLQEFEEAGRAELHPTTLELLTGRSPVGQQLRAFAKDPERSLHKYPDAFVAIQELSLVPLVERRIEGEHAQVKLAAQRGFRWAGPAMVCARKRRHQVLAMLENPSLLQWVCQNWRSRDIFQRVLAHKCLPTTVNLMGRSERYARVYGYAVDDHFRDVEKMQQAARGRAAELKALHPPPQAASHDSKQIVGFLKAHDRWALRALPAPSCMFGTGCQAVPSFPRRRLRRLFERQRANWHRRSPRLQRWGGWPLRAQRVGEASHPGPPAPGTPLGGERPYPTGAARRRACPESPHGHDPMQVDGGVAAQGRVYCPVRGCPCGDSRGQAFQGWASVACMRAHIDCHLAGTLQGEVPAEWMQAQRRQRCRVCGLSVSVRHGIHPTCHPAARAAAGDQPDQAGAPGLPTLADIQAGGTRTLRHVPPAARFLWGRVFTRALAEVVEHNNLRAWSELLMLPQCVLGAPARGGRRHRKAIAAYTLDRLQRWLDGERSGLWHDKHELPGPRARSLTPEQKREFAVALAREGFHKKACNALLSSGLCPDNAETANALRALHPAQPAPEVNFDGLPLAAEVVPDVVAKALRQLPADTAPGPCGLRVQHIREAGPPGASLGMLEHLAATVGLLSQGRACPQVAPVLAGASLVALPKPGGGVRPIAVGEILRRLTSKCLMMMVRDDARQYFAPVQLGVGVPSGAEAAVHTVRAWLQRHHATAGHVMVKLDFTNAFNNVDRRAVLEAVAAAFPGLARWTAWCYGQPAQLRFGASTTLQSAGGVQQGDPLGPLLFATALHQLAQELRTGLALTIFYLDDGIIAGDMAAVGAAVAHLQQRGAALAFSSTYPSPRSSLLATLTQIPWVGTFLLSSCRPLMARLKCVGTLSFWGLRSAPRPSLLSTLRAEFRKPRRSLKPWPRLRTRRLPCDCSNIVLATVAWCMAPGVPRHLVSWRPSGSSMTWCATAFPASLACI